MPTSGSASNRSALLPLMNVSLSRATNGYVLSFSQRDWSTATFIAKDLIEAFDLCQQYFNGENKITLENFGTVSDERPQSEKKGGSSSQV